MQFAHCASAHLSYLSNRDLPNGNTQICPIGICPTAVPDEEDGNVDEAGDTGAEPDAHCATQITEEGVPRKDEHLLILRVHETTDRKTQYARPWRPLKTVELTRSSANKSCELLPS